MSKSNITGKVRRYTLNSKVPDEKLDQMLVMLQLKQPYKSIAFELDVSPETICRYRKRFIQKQLLGE